ncbi:bacteriohemerythrin [Spirochaeta isovalerica]|uniref:Hemerythrin n=1 Tax=Spirochaeta isovalerica TaxID=150 RepID=A0A841R8G7_9SPIO|nr:hemerythrin family protein [Spirochaeta isovalerica]MBB6480183.1 hemerythrin [Spirochaeta isovalerica]
MGQKTIYDYNQKIPEWNESLEIGLDSIDREHRFFLDLIREIEVEALRDRESEFIQLHIDELILYARFHFFSEEIYMKKIKYPDLDKHRELHLQLIGKLSDQVTRFQMKEIHIESIVEFLVNWFKYHTLVEDVKIARFISS